MRLPDDIRERFRQHGRAGGRKRASTLSPEARRGVARRAARARWIRHRFGAPSFTESGLPGGEIVDAGLADLDAGKITVESLLISLASSRLRREGVPVAAVHSNPEDRLFALLSRSAGELAHARYGAYLRQMASFADACRSARRDRRRRAP